MYAYIKIYKKIYVYAACCTLKRNQQIWPQLQIFKQNILILQTNAHTYISLQRLKYFQTYIPMVSLT